MNPKGKGRVELVVLLSALLLALSACGPKESVDDPVAIRIGDREIRLSELQQQIDYSAARGNAFPGNEAQFIERYAERQVMLENAYAQGLQNDIELQRQFENLLIGRLKKNELDAQLASVSVTDDEVKAYFDANIENYTRPAQVRLALLFLEDSGKLSAEQQNALRLQLEAARAEAQALPEGTRGFGVLATNNSEEATSRFKGGDIGWIQAGRERYRWPDEVVESAFSLAQNGEISPVIETDTGYYLLMRIDARAEAVKKLEGRFIASLQTQIIKDKRAALTEQIEAKWREDFQATIDEQVVSQIQIKLTTDAAEAEKAFSRLP